MALQKEYAVILEQIASSVGSLGGGVDYTTRLDEVSDSVSYVGNAVPGSASSDAVWRIKKITVSGTETLVEWAGASGSFNKVWDNRASYSYS